ncbi:shikimate kinase [Seonamhaeicola aphaedonensis]|uniref:Shikimate kinase n=1 Tax=Seonamhaeicola aphaedonensis TaxID=1461338 RepID=A0A3D9H900_9FLAO|nr:shikimate kinase [Seonamhaeicola aphaedonensis]RED45980.1 shikimate kinase [Seonamhaeicola aphaedonensis]
MVVVLIGYMGSGKSSIGRRLSKKLDFDLIDLDDFIEEKENASVKEIFESKGEIYFRKKETEYLKQLLETDKNLILSLGGGTPCFGNNMDIILSNKYAKSIYLKSSIPKLAKKLIKKKAKRPLIAHIQTEDALAEFIGKHIFERMPFYNRAEYVVNTDDKSKDKITKEVMKLL